MSNILGTTIYPPTTLLACAPARRVINSKIGIQIALKINQVRNTSSLRRYVVNEKKNTGGDKKMTMFQRKLRLSRRVWHTTPPG
jgi:hypothetical protein